MERIKGGDKLEDMDLSSIQDERARELIVRLLNLVENLSADWAAAQQEIRRLRDEISRLKGEQGKPTIKPKASSRGQNYSSERERHEPTQRCKQSKNPKIQIDREQVLEVDRAGLPEDVVFKGYEEVVVQDVVFRPDNVLFCKEKFYSPSEHKTYLAELPRGYQGQFGPGLKSLVWVLYFASQVSEPKIVELLRSIGIWISEGEVSNLLIKDQAAWHQEKAEICRAGLAVSPWQQSDDTGTRVKGQNQHCHTICHPLYTAYVTLPAKDRLSVIDALSHERERTYLFNEQAWAYLQQQHMSQKVMAQVGTLEANELMDERKMEQALKQIVSHAGPQQQKWIKDACRVAAYHQQADVPVVQLLVCDDAPQFKGITDEIALCWVHDARHYKKLSPVIRRHAKQLEDFQKQYWKYYRALLRYKQDPRPQEKARLDQRFDELFATRTGYDKLDERIEKTRQKKAGLLAVLEHPEVPLHNNAAELAVRARVRKRDISLGPRTAEGVNAWDTGMTLVETAKKLGVSFYHYIKDRISGAMQMPSLARMIEEQAKQLPLGASWNSS
jgi:hypothetical protein